MTGALAYLLLNTTRNRLLSMARRLRSPRYAVGLVLGIGYFWLLLGRHPSSSPAGTGTARAAATVGSAYATFAPVFVLFVVGGVWLFGGDRSALAFSEAEVSMLLTAPVPRRALVSYKLARSQLVILLNVVLWVFILRRGLGALPPLLSAAAVWVMFTTLSLHRMGAALLRASQVEYRTTERKRRWLAKALGLAVAVTLLAVLLLEPLRAARAPASSGPFALLQGLTVFFSSPGVRAVLYPFRLVVAPIFAQDAHDWAIAMLPALGVVLLHVWWVLRSDAAFEEAAALASAEQARRLEAIRARRSVASAPNATAGTRTIAIASTGRPIVAIVWKNAIALRRTFQGGSVIRMLVMVVIVAGVFGSKSGNVAESVAAVAGIAAALTPLLGMQAVRNDLRSDMMHLPFLKAVPLAGADLVLAEITSSAVPLAAVQLVLVAIAALAIATGARALPVPAGVLYGLLLAAPVVLPVLTLAIGTILNGSAVLFPSWIRLGPAGPGGVELMGQTMLSTIASTIAFALLLLIPAALATAGYAVLRASAPATAAVAAACVLGAVALAAECYGIILALGRAFDRAEPQQIA